MTRLERIIEHYRKFALGFGLATAATGLILAIFDKLNPWQKAAAVAFTYLICGVGAFVWSHMAATHGVKMRINSDEASQGTPVVRPEDHLAHLANQFVRRRFGRTRTITYENYKPWRRHNPLIFTSIVGKDRELYGFFDIFPLRDEAGKKLREGTMNEEEITIKDLLTEQECEQANYIYIATIQSCVVNDFFEARLLEFMVEFVREYYPPRPKRFYLAFAATKEGVALLRRNHFILELSRELTTCRRDFYVLDAERALLAIDRISGVRRVFQHRAKRRRRSVATQATPA